MTKRLLKIGVLIIVAILGFASLIFTPKSTSALISMPPETTTNQSGSGLLFGQKQYYSVIFRGNGEAIVYAKIVATNPDETPLKSISFTMPKVSPSEIVMYQQTLPQECARYDYSIAGKENCLEYQDPNYSNSYYYYGNGKAQYQKIPFTNMGNKYTLPLQTAVAPYKSTSVIISYAAKGYVKKSLGVYKFNFETLKVPSRIQEINVTADVDSDLVLKGKRSQVNYGGGTVSKSLDAAPGITSQNLDDISGRIGSYGAIMKTAKNLAPQESFMVKGAYSTNWFYLYLSSIILSLVIVGAIISGIILLGKFLSNRAKTAHNSEAVLAKQSDNSLTASISIINPVYALMGLLSVGLTVGLSLVFNYIASSPIYSFNPNPFVAIVMVITIILIYALAIFGPAIFVAAKQGWKAFLSIIICQILWLIIFIVIYLVFFQVGLSGNNGGRIVY